MSVHIVTKSRQLVVFVLLVCILSPLTALAQTSESLTVQEIRYHNSAVREVFLVWGIDGWQVLPQSQWPADTFLNDEVMYTPLVQEGDHFVGKINVPSATTLDYGFLLTQAKDGTPISEWDDDDGQDFHTLVTVDGIIEIHSTFVPAAVDNATIDHTSVPDFGFKPLWLVIVVSLIFIAGSIVAKRKGHLSTASFWLILNLVLAANLRLNQVNQPYIDAFSWRQASTAMIAANYYKTNWNLFYPEVSWGGAGPSYQGREFQTVTYTAAILYTLFKPQAWIGRLVSISFGVWGIFALYKLIQYIWDEKRALASAAVMAVLPGSIFIERSFLPDPAMVALMVTSFWVLCLFLKTDRWRYLVLAGILAAWGGGTKLPGLIVGLPMLYATIVILKQKQSLTLKRLSLIGLIALGCLLPVIVYYLWARHLSLSYPPYHFAGGGNWLWNAGVAKWWQQQFFVHKLAGHIQGWLWTPPVMVLVLLGLIIPILEARRQSAAPAQDDKPRASPAVWTFHWWFAAFLVYYLMGAQELNDNPWNYHIINPTAAALCGYAVISLTSFLQRKISWQPLSPVVMVTVLVIIVSVGQSSIKWLFQPYAQQSYEMGLALNQLSQPDDLVVTIADTVGDPIGIYYSQRRGWTFPPSHPQRNWGQLPDEQEGIQLFDELRYAGADWFGVVSQQLAAMETTHPALVNHIYHTSSMVQQTPGYVIFRIQPLDTISPEANPEPLLTADDR